MLAASDTTASTEALTDPILADTGLNPGDLKALAGSLGAAGPGSGTDRTWANLEEGTSGRLSEVADVPVPSGGLCRSFVTTVNAPNGLFLMSGIGCRRADGSWVIDGLAPAEAASQVSDQG